MRKILFSVMTFVLSIVLLAGCNSGPAGTETSGKEEAKGDNEEIKVAMILKTLSNPFWTTMEEGIKEEAEALGVKVEILAAQSEEDSQGQLRMFEDLLNKDYDGIGFAPLSPVNLIPQVVNAHKKGIPTVNIDERVDMEELNSAGGNVNAFVTTDNEKVGEQAGKFIVETIQGGQVAIVEGKAGNASGEARKNGAKSVFDATEGIELVASQPADWDRNKALDVVTNMIQRYPDLKAIYAANDTMALGAQQAVVNAGKKDQIIVVGTDGAPEAIDSVKAGELTATIAQDSAEIGKESLRLLVKAIKEGKIISVDEEAEFVTVPSYIVNE
ncbi:D-allose transporter substrate-binding protein [Bacillus sp. FJAT-50079]|uniref:D-allose transporter substrate-binding protein n=1 Tax=Bacillus sp. FJAT-50079 TaxID=2833577 RepID=UPI001BC98981|nr:D-allose transporter substrate-binding protein [Bacillus sp. FJAT-50079]MBS4207399.1 D-allose transporter substrate-binding protein [Bacillus sp. FJAT-50079]